MFCVIVKFRQAESSADFIGEKGLGFKTTFRLSDDPHVFSNGFNFRLSSKGKIGYIVPYVVDDERLLKRAQQISNSTAESPRTVIMLPLKVSRVVFFSVRFFLKKRKIKSFDDIATNLVNFSRSPMVILFLKKMKFIRVHIERQRSNWTNVFIERIPEANPFCWTVN